MSANDKSLVEIQKHLLQSKTELVNILKVMGHSSRLKILILLLVEPQSFQTLLNETKLKKSALANHLNYLKETNVIENVQHGIYRITQTGKEFLLAIDLAYHKSDIYKLEKQRYQATKSFFERKKAE